MLRINTKRYIYKYQGLKNFTIIFILVSSKNMVLELFPLGSPFDNNSFLLNS